LLRSERRLALSRHELLVARVHGDAPQQLAQIRIAGDDHAAALSAAHDTGVGG
jgi:hypothetical protein